MSGFELTLLELQHILVVVRAHRATMTERKTLLEEKRRLGWDGPTEEALLACENELHLLNGIIAKLWRQELNELSKK